MSRRKEIKKRLSKRVLFRMRLLILISFIILFFVVWDVLRGDISVLLTLLAICIGLIVGLLSGRMTNIIWDENREQVITKMDLLGGAILIAYILFELFRDWIFGHWITGTALPAFGLIVLAFALLGRVVNMGITIRSVLEGKF